MPSLLRQICFIHPSREAAARCPECARVFCRECVSEHEDRVICAACLKRLLAPAKPRRAALTGGLRLGGALLGLLIAWFSFYYLGQALLGLPDSVHDGSVWKPFYSGGDE